MNELMHFARHLARESGERIRPYFRSKNLDLQKKRDQTLVTRADREAEEWMRTEISRQFPRHGIIGEEFGNEREDAEYVWILDPIDGTVSFASGVPLFGTLIGLLKNGQPILGCIHQPILDLLCIGNNHFTTLNDTLSRVSSVTSLSEATLLTTDPGLIEQHQNYPCFESVRRQAGLFRTWGDCFGYLQLVCGHAHAMLDPIMNPWDLLPLIPVVRGAGGKITAWDGSDPTTAASCVAACPTLHAQLIRQLNPDHSEHD